MDVTLERNPGRHREEGSEGIPTKRSRSLGSGGSRVQALRWARGAGTGFARRHLDNGTSESCGSLLASGRANFTDGVRRLARQRASLPSGDVPVASDPSQRPAPLQIWAPSTVSKNRLK